MILTKRDLENRNVVVFQRNKPLFFERIGILLINNTNEYTLEKKAEYYIERINYLLKPKEFEEPIQINISKKGDCLTTYISTDTKKYIYLGYYDLSIFDSELRIIIENLIKISDNKNKEIDYEKSLLKEYLRDKENKIKIFNLCLRYIEIMKTLNKKETEIIQVMEISEFCFAPI